MHATTSTADAQHHVWAELVDIERRLDRLEGRFDELTDEERSHIRAKQRDAREFISRGETKTLVIRKPPEEFEGESALSTINGVYTFIEPGRFDLKLGDTVRAKILDVGPSYAEAIALAVESREEEP